MIGRISLRATVIVAIASVLLVPSSGLAGGPSWSEGEINTSTWSYFDTPRTIATSTTQSSGWSVAFSKRDGPRMYLGARPCGSTSFYEYQILEDYDPPNTYERVADYLAVGTLFCTGAKSLGGNSTDSFNGYFLWD